MLVNDSINLIIPPTVNFSDIEQLTKKILAENIENIAFPDRLVDDGGLGVEGAILQLFSTWLRNSKFTLLQTSIDTLDESSFRNFCNSLYGLCALRLSDKILLNSGEEVELTVALKDAIPIFQEIRAGNFKKAFERPYITIPAIKSPVIKGGKNREFDSPLYNVEEVVGAQKFRQITQHALESLTEPPLNLQDRFVTHLSEILRELFTNTHKHARTDMFGNPLAKNFRAITFNHTNLSAKRLREINIESAKLSAFIALAGIGPQKEASLEIIEITVVDSGPGFARRWYGVDKEQLTKELERSAIVECFKKYNSTDNKESSGSGLTNVLKDLQSLKGWFRLRTGRILVEKQYALNEVSTSIDKRDIKHRDVFMEGAIFNIVIPVKSLSGGDR